MNQKRSRLKEGDDYYLEDGLMVFTTSYHLKKGYCCENNCRHCPYQYIKKAKKTKSR